MRRLLRRLAPEATAALACSADVAWQRACDARAWPAWAPGVTDVRATTQHAVPGTRGRVRVGGVWLPFTVRDFAHMRTLAVQVGGLPGPRVTVTPSDGGGCTVAVRGGPPGWARAALAGLATG